METMLKSQNKDPLQNPILEQCALLNIYSKNYFTQKL